MASSRVIRASDSQCQSRNCPWFDPTSSYTVESEGRQIKQCRIKYRKNPPFWLVHQLLNVLCLIQKCKVSIISSVKVLLMPAEPKYILTTLQNLKGQCHEIFDFWFFFHESVSPKPQGIPLRPFWIFSKLHGDIRSSRCTTSVADPGGKWKNLQS